MEDKKKDNNTSMIIIIVVIVLVLIGGITYFVMANSKDNNQTNTNIDENAEIDDNNTNNTADVTGSYSGKFEDDDKSLADDVKDAVTDENKKIELVLSDDGTARLALSETVHDGTYSLDAKKLTVVISDSEDEVATSKTYEFTVNDDDTLTYSTDNEKVTLKKVNDDKLEYIK